MYRTVENEEGVAEVASYDDSDLLGLRVLYNSDEVCVAATAEAGAEMYGFEFAVTCDETVVNAENQTAFHKAVVDLAASDLSGCVSKVALKHNAGCPVYSALGFVNFLNNNVWLSGTLLVVFGLTIGLLGQRWFLPICGTFGAMVAFVAFMVFASIFQWLNTTVGLIICGILALACGAAAYWALSADRVATMFLCIGGGFMLGSIIEGLFIALFSWESMIFYLIITGTCMAAGGYLGCKKPDLVKKYLTATVGSYIFMRGWTYFLGGFPSELEMYSYMAHANSEELDVNGLFYFYVALFVGGVFAFVYIQSEWKYAHNPNAVKDDVAHDGDYNHSK